MNNLTPLNQINFCQLEELLRDQAKIRSEVSFWGHRRVKVEGKKGHYSLCELLNFIYKRMHSYAYSENERLSGRLLKYPIKKILEDTDKSYEIRNVFSRFLCSIIDAWLNFFWYTEVPKGPMHQFIIFEGIFDHTFKFYSKAQYFEVFNKAPIRPASKIENGIEVWRVNLSTGFNC